MHDLHESPPPEVTHTGPFAWYQRTPLYLRIVAALIIGVIAGLKLGHWAVNLAPFSSVVLRLLGALATPLIFVAVIRALVKAKISGRTGAQLLFQLFLNTTVAIIIGLLIANTLQPGTHTHIDASLAQRPSQIPFDPVKDLLGKLPGSVLKPLSENDVMGVIIIALAIGAGLRKVREQVAHIESERSVIQLIEAFLDAGFRLIMVVLHWVLELIPFAVFCVVAANVGKEGLKTFLPMVWFVGAVLIAILIGPWAAVVAVSCALAIQALFFGDGGVLAFGANCFNMAFVMPMVGYAVYKMSTRNLSLTAPRRAVGAGIAGYAGLNAAALCAAIEIGIQPTLFHTANGTPLYAPFHLSQSIPAMALAHLTVAGAVELVLTAGVVAYLQRANLPVLRINHPDVDDTIGATPRRPGWRLGAAALGLGALLTPLGLLASGSAFGEDPHAGYWHHALFNGYDFGHDRHPALAYIVSALVGMAAIALVVGAGLTVAGIVRRRQAGSRPTAGSAQV